MLAKIVAIEGPVSISQATRRILRACGIQRAGSRIQETIQKDIRVAKRTGSITERNGFLWKPGEGEMKFVRVPVPGEPETYRNPGDIPPEEYAVAVTEICRAALSLSKESLITNVARVFGFGRTGKDVRCIITSVIDSLVSRKVLVEREGQITSG